MRTSPGNRPLFRPKVFQNKFPHDTYLKMINALWGIILRYMCWGTSRPPPPKFCITTQHLLGRRAHKGWGLGGTGGQSFA